MHLSTWMKPFFVATALALAVPSAGFAAGLNCAALDGQWSGTMKGLLNGKTTIELKNCRLKWKLPDGRTNSCRYKERKGRVEYSCSLGSRGIVAIKGNRITMQNVYTAAQHGGKYTVNVSRQ